MHLIHRRGPFEVAIVGREDVLDFANADAAYFFLRQHFVTAGEISELRQALIQAGEKTTTTRLDDEQILRIFARKLHLGLAKAVVHKKLEVGKLVAEVITEPASPGPPPPPPPAPIPPPPPPPVESDAMLDEVEATQQAEALEASSEAGSAFCEA